MILFNFDNSDVLTTCVFYNNEDKPIYVHPLAKMLSGKTRSEALEYIRMRGWSFEHKPINPKPFALIKDYN